MDEPEPVALRRNVTRIRTLAVHGETTIDRPDLLAVEEPMEIRVQGPGQAAVAVAVTMRTPGNDFDLAAGFLFTEGLIDGRMDLRRVSYCEDLEPEEQQYNVVTVELSRRFDPDVLRRNFFANSSCGVCGKATIEEVEVHCAPLASGPVVGGSVIAGLPEELRRAQKVFETTGGLHAAGLFEPGGGLLTSREDVGRHNAVDKIIGDALFAEGLPLADRVLQVSGRIGFEIVQKAARGGIGVLSAVGAPSSLAVRTAERLGMTLVGFVREGRFNVYTHAERISLQEQPFGR